MELILNNVRETRTLVRKVASYALASAILLVLGTGTARADLWQVTFSGDLAGSAGFTTDGVCSVCFSQNWLGGGIDTFTANLGTFLFDIASDSGLVTFNRSTGSLSLSALYNPNQDVLAILGNNWYVTTPQFVTYSGTYSVSDPPVPEPASAAMLSMLLLGLLGWRATIRAKARRLS